MSRRHDRRGFRRLLLLLPAVVLLLLGILSATPVTVGPVMAGSPAGGPEIALPVDHPPMLSCEGDCAGGGWPCAGFGFCSTVVLPAAQQEAAAARGGGAFAAAQRGLKPHPPAVLLHPPKSERG